MRHMDIEQEQVNEKDKNVAKADGSGDSAENLQLDTSSGDDSMGKYVPEEKLQVDPSRGDGHIWKYFSEVDLLRDLPPWSVFDLEQKKPVNKKDKNVVKTDGNVYAAQVEYDPFDHEDTIKVICLVRPLLEDQVSIVEFPDDVTVRVSPPDNRDFKFDSVYGPHAGKVDLRKDVEPFVKSAIDGGNVAIFGYGAHTGKLEGSIDDLDLYAWFFKELFSLSQRSTSIFEFFVSISEHNEQIRDLLRESGLVPPTAQNKSFNPFYDLVFGKVEKPSHFDRVLEIALGRRDTSRPSHLVVTVQIHRSDSVYGDHTFNNIFLVDLAGNKTIRSKSTAEEDSEVTKSPSLLRDFLTSSISDNVDFPFGNSTLFKLLAASLGTANILLIVNICQDASNLDETLSSLNFSTGVRNRDTIKKERDIANDTRLELYDKEKVISDVERVVSWRQAYDMEKEITDLKQGLNRQRDELKAIARLLAVKFGMQADDMHKELFLYMEDFTDLKQQVSILREKVERLQLSSSSSFHVKGADTSPAVITDANVQQQLEIKSNDQGRITVGRNDTVKMHNETPDKEKGYGPASTTTEKEASKECVGPTVLTTEVEMGTGRVLTNGRASHNIA